VKRRTKEPDQQHCHKEPDQQHCHKEPDQQHCHKEPDQQHCNKNNGQIKQSKSHDVHYVCGNRYQKETAFTEASTLQLSNRLLWLLTLSNLRIYKWVKWHIFWLLNIRRAIFPVFIFISVKGNACLHEVKLSARKLHNSINVCFFVWNYINCISYEVNKNVRLCSAGAVVMLSFTQPILLCICAPWSWYGWLSFLPCLSQSPYCCNIPMVIVLLLADFVITWVEVWFIDSKVLPGEAKLAQSKRPVWFLPISNYALVSLLQQCLIMPCYST